MTRASVALVLFTFSPLAVTAGSVAAADDPTPCVAPSSSQPGVHVPTGSDAGTFSYQCSGPYTGLYYNGYYTYDPVSGARTPTYALNYGYDCTGNVWMMDQYNYSPARGAFTKSRVPATTTPNLPTGCPVPVTTPPASGGGNPSSVSGTGTGSQNSANADGTINTSANNTNNLGMSNTIGTNGTSGGAFVIGNTTAGNATSGAVMSEADIINMLQSSSNVLGPNTATFTTNINGDVNGDFMFDPNANLSGTGSTSQNGINNNLQINATTTNATNANINNDINVSAASGDAAVSGNTTAGNATSGDATAIVQLMNFINSSVAAGQSFVGTININGSLNGDILLPQNFIDQLLAASGTGSANAASNNLGLATTTTNNTTADIANNLTSTATSGNAAVSGNTTGGDATSGKTRTGVTLLNLTGSNVVGANDLLVFVNVLGTWVGMIVNAPAGSTAASLGGGIVSNTGSGFTDSLSNNLSGTATTTNTANFGITNNVQVSASTGDASVTHNTTGGNATSGNATTAVNILNATNSTFSLSNWFGVLFINVFGNWTGSFGVNTSAGNPVATANPAAPTSRSSTAAPGSGAAAQFASFIAHNSGGSTTTNNTTANQPASAVLGSATTVAKKTAKTASTILPTPDNANHASYALPIIGFIAAGVILLIGERERLFGKRK